MLLIHTSISERRVRQLARMCGGGVNTPHAACGMQQARAGLRTCACTHATTQYVPRDTIRQFMSCMGRRRRAGEQLPTVLALLGKIVVLEALDGGQRVLQRGPACTQVTQQASKALRWA